MRQKTAGGRKCGLAIMPESPQGSPRQ